MMAEASSSDRGARAIQAILLGLSIALIFSMYHFFGNTTEVQNYTRSAFTWMVRLWGAARIYGESGNWVGWLAPLASLIILWTHRHELRAAPKATFWPGLGLLILGVTLHWMGARAQQTRLSLLALILILWSIPLFLGGRRIGRLTLFPAALLVYCVPLNFLDVATFPMRIVSAAVAFVLLNGMGVAVTLAGSALVSDPPGAFVINGADSASGLGLLLIVSAFAAILAHYHQTRPLRQLVVFASCVPAVVIANILRLAVVAGWADALGEASALAANHRVAYAAVLVTSCLLVLGSSLCLNVDFRQLAKTWSPRK